MKKYLLICLIMVVLFSGCQSTKDKNDKSYFLEPKGYVIAEIEHGEKNFFGYSESYGYISNDDYKKFIEGNLKGMLVVLHPYEQNKSIAIKSDTIVSILTGKYVDYR